MAVDTAPLRRSPHLFLFGRTGLLEKKVGEVAQKAKEIPESALIVGFCACESQESFFRNLW